MTVGHAPADRASLFAFGAWPHRRAGPGIPWLVRLILERVGGRVEAGDAPGGGARFTVTIPRRAASARMQGASFGANRSVGVE